MKLTKYFIENPVPAIILNILIVIIGLLSTQSLLVREYPEVVIPRISVDTTYPNASTELVESSITNILEDELAGVEGLDSMTSETGFSISRIILNFHPDTSMDRALIATRAAVGAAKSKFPNNIKEPTIRSGISNEALPFMAACLESTSLANGELTHFVNTSIKNGFRSIKGVASVQVWGSNYMYKVTLDHQKLYSFGINADEIYNAISKRANTTLPAGKFQKTTPTTIVAEIKDTNDLENILIKDQPEPVYLKYVADIKLADETDSFRIKINGQPGLCIGINRSSDSNPFDTSSLVHKYVDNVAKTLPNTIKIQVLLDQADFIRSSLDNIKSSILEAIVFVLIIVFLFLRNIKSTLIPIITIPISLIGSFFFLKVFGFSINIMTMLAMVLAIGLVVDDAIVILENITRHIELGKSAKQAAIDGAKEIGFAIVAMTLTLTSVYAPIAFIGGLTGQLFIEFAIALAGSVIISGITALTLSPLMCAKFITASDKHMFPKIDLLIDNLTNKYHRLLIKVLEFKKTLFVFCTTALAIMILLFKIVPQELTPKEDRGVMGVWITPGKDFNSTEKHTDKVNEVIKTIPERLGDLTFVFDGGGQSIPLLKPIEERKRSTSEIANSIRPMMTSFPSFDAYVWTIDTGLPGLEGSSDNSELTLMISTTDSYQNLFDQVESLKAKATEVKLFRSAYHNLQLDDFGYNVLLDHQIMAKHNINEDQISKTIETFFSGNKTLEFKKDGIIYPIMLEGDAKPWQIDSLYITDTKGHKISLGIFAKLNIKQEPKYFQHYNQMRSVAFKVSLSEDDNIQDAMKVLYKFADENLPSSYQKSWTGIAKTFDESSSVLHLLFVLAVLFIYGILAVQFNNFTDPLIILFTIPLACTGALITMYFTNVSLNIYSQIGLITLIGLITKHGILIVEFANQLLKQDYSMIEAITKSAQLRLRPILMTTAAMIAGSVPLILSSSSGFEARNAIGIVLVSGLIFGTILTLFILPFIYINLKSLFSKGNSC